MNRWSYVLWRVLQVIPTFFVVMVLVFVVARLLPGDPLTAILGERATDEMVARAKQELGLDKPIVVQFWIFFENFFRGNLGESINLHIPVSRLIAERMPVTLFLTLYAALLAAVLAVPLAFVAALRKDSWLDSLIRGVFQLGLSMPVFYIGLQLLTLLGAKLRWFPVGGYGNNFAEHLHYLFLPALTLGFNLAAILMRNLRSAILEVLQAEYVDFARAKGLRQSLILGKHVLRNALISTVTLFGLNIGGLIGGAVITETVFAIPGVGRLMVESIFGRDYPVIQGLTLTFAILVSLTFILTDILHAQLDPRVEIN